MSSRKVWYRFWVVLVAVIMTWPQITTVFQIVASAYENGRFFVDYSRLQIPGLGPTVNYGNSLSSAPFWRGKFIHLSYGSSAPGDNQKWTVLGTDPGTGSISRILSVDIDRSNWYTPRTLGDRLWLVGASNVYEVVDGKAVPVPLGLLSVGWMNFLWHGELALMSSNNGDICIADLPSTGQKQVATVVMPEHDRARVIDGVSIDFRHALWLECLQFENGPHLFATVNGKLLYRKGLDFREAISAPGTPQHAGSDILDADVAPVSALMPANTDADLEGWSLICVDGCAEVNDYFATRPDCQSHGMCVEGQPAALVVNGLQQANPVGRIYRFDGKTWTHAATQQFPFGTISIRCVTTWDGQRSYVMATTSTADIHIYAVESHGLRKTNGSTNHQSHSFAGLREYPMVPVLMLVLGLFCGLFTSIIMALGTKPDYCFGTQTIRLASLQKRGSARLIDLGIIFSGALFLGWMLTRGFDWLALSEALNLHVDHPTRTQAARIACIVACWVFLVASAMIVIQARWGFTLGKWLLGLRTVRTSLRPCGLAGSLARELVFVVDCGLFLCWTPGIACIALTDHRQRLGDLVADTIVLDNRWLVGERARLRSDAVREQDESFRQWFSSQSQ